MLCNNGSNADQHGKDDEEDDGDDGNDIDEDDGDSSDLTIGSLYGHDGDQDRYTIM